MLPEALSYGFMQRAFVAGLLSGSALSVVGVFIVLKRMSNIGEGLSNIAFAGLAVGVLLGSAPLPLAFAASIAGVFLIQYLSSKKGVFGEAAVQILCSGGFAVGVIIVSASRGFNVNLLSYLFGSLLSVSDYDILLIGALTAVTFALVAAKWTQLKYAVFDEDSARTAGVPVERLNLLLMVLTAASVVAGMRVVGILLVSSLLVVPAAAAITIGRSFKQTVLLALAYAIASVIAGLFGAYYLNVAAGGAVVLTQAAMFFATALASRK